MPRVTEAYREARRDEIATAMLRCMTRVGYSRLSMADIFAESGLSAGSVYSHFGDKAEIGLFVAHRVHRTVLDDLQGFDRRTRASGDPVDPAQLVRWLLGRIREDAPDFAALLQLWAESTVDRAMRAAIREDFAAVRAALAGILATWAADQARSDRPAEIVTRAAIEGVLILCNGFISRTAMFGPVDVDRYLETMRQVVGEAPGSRMPA